MCFITITYKMKFCYKWESFQRKKLAHRLYKPIRLNYIAPNGRTTAEISINTKINFRKKKGKTSTALTISSNFVLYLKKSEFCFGRRKKNEISLIALSNKLPLVEMRKRGTF